MRRREHERRLVEQAEAYRWEIEKYKAERDQAQRQLRIMIDATAPHVDIYSCIDGMRRLVIELDPFHLTSLRHEEIVNLLHRRLMERLLDLAKDYRGDMRQTEAQRMLAV